MLHGKVTFTFQVENVDGKTLDEIFDIVNNKLEEAGLVRTFSPLWEKIEVFDEKGKYVDGDYC